MAQTTYDDPMSLLLDSTVTAVSMSQAAAILGIAKSSAHKAVRETGQLCNGVPVVRIGKRQIVSVFHLRSLLGVDMDNLGKEKGA